MNNKVFKKKVAYEGNDLKEACAHYGVEYNQAMRILDLAMALDVTWTDPMTVAEVVAQYESSRA